MVGLAVYAQVHDVVAADGAVVDDDVPGPERDGVPLDVCVSYGALKCAPHALHAYLLNLELLLSVGDVTTRAGFGALDLGRSACIGHLDIGHGWVDCVGLVNVVESERWSGVARCGVA